jgi:septation ring formation regulator EzrA
MCMIINVSTKSISLSEWNKKIREYDTKWLILQCRGLRYLLNTLEDEIDATVEKVRTGKDEIPDEIYRTTIYPLEDQCMDLDAQLVEIEDEIDRLDIDMGIDVDAR